jgi:hypothetical protein
MARDLVEKGYYEDADDLLQITYQMIQEEDQRDPKLQDLLDEARRVAGMLRVKLAPGVGASMGAIGPPLGDTPWIQGERYSVRVGEVYWLDQGQYHGVADVEIRDNVTEETFARRGDVKLIGNFSPIWVNFRGNKILIEQLVSLEAELPFMTTPERERTKLEKRLKTRGYGSGPREWLPKKKKRGHGDT